MTGIKRKGRMTFLQAIVGNRCFIALSWLELLRFIEVNAGKVMCVAMRMLLEFCSSRLRS